MIVDLNINISGRNRAHGSVIVDSTPLLHLLNADCEIRPGI
jgi:hypothetical protein